jgi:hypothetical protein
MDYNHLVLCSQLENIVETTNTNDFGIIAKHIEMLIHEDTKLLHDVFSDVILEFNEQQIQEFVSAYRTALGKSYNYISSSNNNYFNESTNSNYSTNEQNIMRSALYSPLEQEDIDILNCEIKDIYEGLAEAAKQHKNALAGGAVLAGGAGAVYGLSKMGQNASETAGQNATSAAKHATAYLQDKAVADGTGADGLVSKQQHLQNTIAHTKQSQDDSVNSLNSVMDHAKMMGSAIGNTIADAHPAAKVAAGTLGAAAIAAMIHRHMQNKSQEQN